MRLAVALLFAALALPAKAQDILYSDQATQFCLDTAQTVDGRQSCIGKSAQVCMNTPAGGSTVGMGGCLDAERAFWDRMLNANYGLRMTEAKRADTEAGQHQQGLQSQAEALRDMQRAWIIYRDAACTYERSQWGGGSGGGPATIACLMRLTGLQALSLAARTY